MKLRRNKLVPIRFENTARIMKPTGMSSSRLEPAMRLLLAERNSMLSDWQSDGSYMSWPDGTLRDYEASRHSSPLGQLFRCATRLHAIADRIVVLGDNATHLAAKAIMDGCCQPFWNHLSRADRGSKPRMVFDGHAYDNDFTQALLHLLDVHRNRRAMDEQDRWGLVIIDRNGSTSPATSLFRHFLQALENSIAGGSISITELVVVVTQRDSELHKMTAALPIQQYFFVPNLLPSEYEVLSWPGLVPAAILGVNVIELLQGASDMSTRFASAHGNENIILDYVADRVLARVELGSKSWRWQTWNESLRGFVDWQYKVLGEMHDRLLDVSAQRDALSMPEVLLQQLVATDVRFDALTFVTNDASEPKNVKTVSKSLPQLTQQVREFDLVMRSQSRQWCNRLSLTRVDELALGQLFQMMMLVDQLEKRIAGSFVTGSKIPSGAIH